MLQFRMYKKAWSDPDVNTSWKDALLTRIYVNANENTQELDLPTASVFISVPVPDLDQCL